MEVIHASRLEYHKWLARCLYVSPWQLHTWVVLHLQKGRF